MESFFPPLEALFDERAKHPVLLVDAVEESANVTLPAEIASGELYRMTLDRHISPHYERHAMVRIIRAIYGTFKARDLSRTLTICGRKAPTLKVTTNVQDCDPQ